ncbi:MAG: hypothetical protein K8J09_04870 [Planctomycetes bacterium]|nr:hypothetical protein [Planctomycetota bacterium]
MDATIRAELRTKPFPRPRLAVIVIRADRADAAPVVLRSEFDGDLDDAKRHARLIAPPLAWRHGFPVQAQVLVDNVLVYCASARGCR